MTQTLTAETPTAQGSDYARLSRLIRERGLLRRRPGYYALKMVVDAVLFAGGWAAFAMVGDSWWQLVVAGYLGLVWTHIAFLGHDIGHRQVFAKRRAATVGGLVFGNLAIGVSRGWWVDKHNRHHSHPNHVGQDPDIGDGVIVWTPEQAARRSGLARGFARMQGRLFFPLLLLEGLNLHVSSVRSARHRWVEAAALAAHGAAYLGVLFWLLSPGKAIAFLLLHKAVWGLYMGATFAPNHKGMPIIGPDEKIDFLRRQVLTSRNVRGGRLISFLLGGLNYQVEHHLFPSMPRPALRVAQPLVRDYCLEHGIAYTETGLIESYRIALRHLDEVGAH
jgi:fatty acid desaturase